MSLKELTMENHRNAERAWFASRMFSGQITNPEYAIYLKQQFESYKALEDRFDNVDSNSGVSLYFFFIASNVPPDLIYFLAASRSKSDLWLFVASLS